MFVLIANWAMFWIVMTVGALAGFLVIKDRAKNRPYLCIRNLLGVAVATAILGAIPYTMAKWSSQEAFFEDVPVTAKFIGANRPGQILVHFVNSSGSELIVEIDEYRCVVGSWVMVPPDTIIEF